jgi:hypothetical protein
MSSLTNINNEIPQETSKLWDVATYFSNVIPWASNSAEKEIEKWDTEMIDGSLCNRLTSADKYLERVSKIRSEIQVSYDKAVITTKNIRSQYDNNLECINNKVAEIRKEVLEFQKQIELLELSDPTTTTIDAIEKSNEITLNAVNQLFDFSEKLRFKISNSGSGMFKHIDVQGVQTLTDYYQAIELNKRILLSVAESHEHEIPLKKKLIEIDASITKVNKEIDLIKQFKIDHTKITTENKGPVISGAPKLMLTSQKD